MDNALKLNRVPKIVLSYWIIKMAATTLGETGADHLSKTLEIGYAITSLGFLISFLGLLLYKLKEKKYSPILYWLLFTSTSLAGTAICDFMDRTLGLGYQLGSALLLSVFVFILFLWKKVEGSLSVESIETNKAEIFYWTAFLVSNTLGTAVGDYLADDLQFGFGLSSILIGSALLMFVALFYFTKVSRVALFWFAFVLTRPFGATFGDFLTKPFSEGGLNLGTLGSSAFFVVVLLYFVFREHHEARTLSEG